MLSVARGKVSEGIDFGKSGWLHVKLNPEQHEMEYLEVISYSEMEIKLKSAITNLLKTF